jgi:hypothetical protein
MKELVNHKRTNGFVCEFIEIIQTRMLIIESLKGDGTKNGRASTKNIAGDLDDMRKKHFGDS